MSLIYAHKNRGITHDIVIKDGNDNAITPGSNDKVRVMIGREGEASQLTITTDAGTANGSSLTKGATNRLRLDASDLQAIPAGTYTLYVDYFDYGDSSEWKTVDRQVFHLEGTVNDPS